LLPYQINVGLLAKVENPDVIVMHCLPASHDLNTQIGQEIYEKYCLAELEITDEVFHKYSEIIFQEAENRMHSIKAIMYNSLKNI
ncbi:ornithine carbamoyltransferase, partial [Streptococcus thermophilus]|nr:ornithine carbamoyltransferase [Streptococcus thermophilus]